MKRLHKYWLLTKKGIALAVFILLFGASHTALAQRPTFSFQAQLSADSILIGDHVELTIQASLPDGYALQFPFFADTLITGIEVLGQPIIDTVPKKTGESEYIYRLKLTSFDAGYYRIPPFRLPFSIGDVKDTAQTSPIWFLVNTLPPDSTIATIYDIKLPMAEPLTFAEVAPWIGVSLLLAAIIALLVYYLVKRKRGEHVFFNAKPAEPPHIIALRGLAKIKEQKLWSTDNHKQYQSVLTDIIRNYIDGRFGVPAMEQTTHETIRSLKGIDSIDAKLLNDLQDTLSLADLVKFAKFTPNVADNEAGLSFGFRFVNETKVEEVDKEVVEETQPQESSSSQNISKALPVEPTKTSEK